MFTRSTVSRLLAADPPLAVSIFLPTHVRGSEVRQDPIRLNNLIAIARDKLLAIGMPPVEADAFLAPAAELVGDYEFWQRQSHGLALFLDGSEARHFQVPITAPKQVVVGPGFHLRALLPAVAADDSFVVLTLTADRVRLYQGYRFALVEDQTPELTRSLDDVPGEPDYQNPVQASPVARPNTGAIHISNAQVYGYSPQEWRKSQLVRFAKRVAADVDALQAGDPLPVVLVGNAELSGHFQQASRLGAQLVGTVETNPEVLTDAALHDAVYPQVQPRLDGSRRKAADRFATLLGQGDPRAVVDIGDVVRGRTGDRSTAFC